MTRFPNRWKCLRQQRGLELREVAEHLGHLNIKYYQSIESGSRFPGPRIIFILLNLFQAELSSAYPELSGEARRRLTRCRT